MNTEYEKTLTPEQLETMASKKIQDVEDSFNRCDTDGCLTQWAGSLEAQRLRLQAEINRNNGLSSFPALFDLNGNRVRAKLTTIHPFHNWITNTVWMFFDANDKPTGKFITAFPKRQSTMEKKGYKESTEMVQSKAIINGRGYGLSGSAWAEKIRLDNGYPENAK